MKAPASKAMPTTATPGIRLAAAAGLLLAALVARPAAALDVPYLSGPVVDEARLLDTATTERLDQQLRQLKQDTGVQLQVLTVPGLEGEPLEDYSLKVAETWKLGREGTDRGVLLLVARDDRKIRIEVGYGLEGLLTDAQSRRVIANVLTPRFREGDFNGGISQTVDAIAGTLRGQPDLIPEDPPAQDLPAGIRGFLLMFLLFFVLPAIRAPGAGAWILYVFLMPFIFGLPAGMFGLTAGIVALAAWLIGFPLLRRIVPPARATSGSRRGGWMSGGGWSSGGGGGGGWSSGGGGGGGWSGGGGSFGGGGASGSW